MRQKFNDLSNECASFIKNALSKIEFQRVENNEFFCPTIIRHNGDYYQNYNIFAVELVGSDIIVELFNEAEEEECTLNLSTERPCNYMELLVWIADLDVIKEASLRK